LSTYIKINARNLIRVPFGVSSLGMLYIKKGIDAMI